MEHLSSFQTPGSETASLIQDVALSFGRRDILSRSTTLKRQREDKDEEEGYARDSAASPSRKRPRTSDVDSSSDNQSIGEAVHWKDYVCDDSDGTDSTYAPSIGSSEDDDAHMTQEDRNDACIYIERSMKFKDLYYVSEDLSSGEESEEYSDDESQTEILWKDYPSEDESDSDDPDYVPPAWNFEDVLEIVSSKAAITLCYKDMDRLRYINELIDRGTMSDAGISDSDNDGGENFRDLSTLRRSIEWLYDVPHHLKKYSTLAPYLRRPTSMPNLRCRLRDLRKEIRDWYEFYARELYAKGSERRGEPGWEICDMDSRLDTVLTNDHLEYAFDHDEWKGFENPRRSPTPIPLQGSH